MPRRLVPPVVENIVIMAPGPSLTAEQVDMVHGAGLFTIAVGDAGRVMYPQCSVMYHCEKKYWDHYGGCPYVPGVKVSLESTDWRDVYQCPASTQLEGVTKEWPYLVIGNNSGYQAINLALHFNPKTIILIGYDLKKSKSGQYNVIGDHPRAIKRPSGFPLFIERISSLANPLEELGVKVYNCTIDTNLNCFQRKDLADAIASIRTQN